MNQTVHVCEIPLGRVREEYDLRGGVYACYLGQDERFSVRTEPLTCTQLRYPILNFDRKILSEVDFSGEFSEINAIKFLQSGYLVEGAVKGEKPRKTPGFRKTPVFYVTDEAGRPLHELRIGLAWLGQCAQNHQGNLLVAYRTEERFFRSDVPGRKHMPNGLCCWSLDGSLMEALSIPQIDSCDFVTVYRDAVLAGADYGNAWILQNSGERIPVRIADHDLCGAAFSAQTLEVIAYRPNRHQIGLTFYISRPGQDSGLIIFVRNQTPICIRCADAYANRILFSDRERCYTYTI